jgi:hypothetical protein
MIECRYAQAKVGANKLSVVFPGLIDVPVEPMSRFESIAGVPRMSEEEKTAAVAKVDEKTFKSQVDQFVQHHRIKQLELLKDNKRRNMSLKDVIQRSPILPDEAVERLFADGQGAGVSEEVISQVFDSLKDMQGNINALDPRRRFYILETINFFSSKIGIGKLIPALVTLGGEDQRKAISEFVFPTFFSIQKNVETLVACDEIFDTKSVHIDRGGLYVFISDISRIAIRLFKKDFLKQVAAGVPTLAFMSTAFDPTSFKFNEKFKAEGEFAYQEMIDDEDKIREIVLDFIVAIQSHESLYTYSIKRDQFYKNFLAGLTEEDRFKGVDPIDVSKILAGCLIANEQFQPPDGLIDRMIDKKTFDADDTQTMCRQFIDNLSPSIIYRMIGRLRVSLQHISKKNFGNEFQEVQKFSVKSILKNVWTGFIALVEKGLSATTEPFIKAFAQVKRSFEGFVEEEKTRDETVTSSLLDDTALNSPADGFQSKNLDAFSQMTQSFQLVETNIISFRGEHEGATFKDFGHNTRLFRNDEGLMVQFLSVFKLLFKKLVQDDKVKEVTYESQRQIREYYAAYQFDHYLICIGLTHIRNPKLPVIEEKSIFPYAILFAEGKTRKEGKAASRIVKHNGQTKIYNDIGFSGKTAKVFFEALYLVLHLLPGEDWEKKSAQRSIGFLTKELNRFISKKDKLLYCEGKL